MRVHRLYHCDFGHHWTVVSQQGTPEKAEDRFCLEGHEAVTCNEQLPADRVQLLLRPAARIVDRVRGTIWYGERYYVALFDRADRELRTSEKQYTWEEAIALAAVFKDRDER